MPLAVLAVLAACGGAGPTDRQAIVAERGSRVMPFDLEATTHRFDPHVDGLTQMVVVDDPTDTEQLSLVREHLRHEADQFAVGDFDDPAHIHGDAMPGLADLRTGYTCPSTSPTPTSPPAARSPTAPPTPTWSGRSTRGVRPRSPTTDPTPSTPAADRK